MIIMKDDDKILKDQLTFYKKNGIQVHIIKTNTRFYNGDILEIEGDKLILDDRVLGAMPIDFIEIDILEKFK